VRECLPGDVAGDLSGAESAEVRRHVARCPGCRRARGRIAAILEAARRLDAPPLSEGFSHAVMARLALQPRTHRHPRRWVRVAAVAAGLVVAVSAMLLRREPTPVRPERGAGLATFVSSLDGVTRRAGRTGAGALGALADAGRQALAATPTRVQLAEAPSLRAALREGSSALGEDLQAADRALRRALRDVEAGLPWL